MSDAPRAAMSDAPRAAMSDAQTTLAGIVSEAVGPLPRVCAEQVLRDLERARMTAEDFRAGNSVCTVYGETFRQRVASQREHMTNVRAHIRTLLRRERELDAMLDEDERTLRGVTLFARLTDAESALAGVRMVLDRADVPHMAGAPDMAGAPNMAGEDNTAEDEDNTAEDEEGNMDVIMETEGGDVE